MASDRLGMMQSVFSVVSNVIGWCALLRTKKTNDVI